MIANVNPADLSAWLETAAQGGKDQDGAAQSRAKPVVLDVREPWELQTASVKPEDGFTLVAIPMNSIPARVAELDPATPVACLCHHGARSMRVAAFLAQNGFESVANITGGIDAWSTGRDATVPRY